jgi:hypothetical protein
MSDLEEKIRMAQARAGEQVVLEDAHDRGICLDSCMICEGRKQKSIGLFDPVILQGPILDTTLAARGSIYGDFTNNARVAQQMRAIIRAAESWGKMTWVEQEALDAIILKISRIATGDPRHPDNWHDIQGYAKLAEDRCSRTPIATP